MHWVSRPQPQTMLWTSPSHRQMMHWASCRHHQTMHWASHHCRRTLHWASTLLDKQCTWPLTLQTFVAILLGVGAMFLLPVNCSAGPVSLVRQRSHHRFLRFETRVRLTCSLSQEQTEESHVCDPTSESVQQNKPDVHASVCLVSSNSLLTYSVKLS